jgi:serine/threonine protein kinase
MQIEVLGERYQLQDPIGRGGMAVIYRGRDLRMERIVAIKVLREAYSTDPKFVTRFQREAKAASSLNHPNIVQVYDYGQTDGNYFIVMELVDGSDLRRYMRSRGVLDVQRAVTVAHDVAMGLGAAHRRNIVHRDVKPQNILIGRHGVIKLTDFGIASVYKDINAERLTTTGMTLGTVQYYAPEQAQGEIVSPAADVYALGIVMYEMLTGRTPFDGDTPVAVAMQHLQDAPLPPSQLNPNIPPALEEIILRCLEKVPEMRYRDGSMLARALTQFIEEELGESPAKQATPGGVPTPNSNSGVNHQIPPRPTSSPQYPPSSIPGRSSSSPNHMAPYNPSGPGVPPNGAPRAEDVYAAQTVAGQGAAMPAMQTPSGFEPQQGTYMPLDNGSGATRPFQRGSINRSGVVQEPRESNLASVITVLILIATLVLLGFSIYLAYVLGFISIPGLAPTNKPPAPNGIVVPSLIGLTDKAARARAASAGFNFAIAPGSVQMGCVTAQAPDAGNRASRGDQIEVTLSATCPTTPTSLKTVPAHLVGQPLLNVESALSQAGISGYALKSAGHNVAVPQDTVENVDPPSGTQLQPGQTLTVYVWNCTQCANTVTPTPGITPSPSPAPSPTPTTPPTPTPTIGPSPTPTTGPSPTPTTGPSPTPTAGAGLTPTPT